MLEELRRMERLLIAPDRDAMRVCESTLASLVPRIQRNGVPESDRQHLKRLIHDIRFLLDRANAFWQSRQRATMPVLQYSAGGWLTAPASLSTLNLEV